MEHTAKTLSTKAGLTAALANALRGQGTGAPGIRRGRGSVAVLVFVCAAVLCMSGVASGAVIHEFKRQLVGTCENGSEAAVSPDPCPGSKLLSGFSHARALALSTGGDLYVANEEKPAGVDRLSASGGAADFSCGVACKEYVSGEGLGNEITGGLPGTGTGILTLLADGTGTLEGATGSGFVTPGSNTITGVTITAGAVAVGEEIVGAIDPSESCISPGLEITITAIAGETLTLSKAVEGGNCYGGNSTAKFYAGFKEVTNLTTTEGAFAAGQEITGAGIAEGTTITEVGAHSLKLSKFPSRSGNVALSAGSKEITSVTTTTGSFAVGQEIEAPGLPAGTTITAINGTSLEVSRGALASESASFAAHQSFGAVNGVAVDDATGDIYVSISSAVDVFSETGEYRFQLVGTCETPGESAVEPGACPHSKLIPFHTVEGEHQRGQVNGLAVDQSALNLHGGDLYVAVDEKGEVDVFDAATGEFVSAVGSGVLSSRSTLTVAVNELDEDVYVGQDRERGAGGGAVDVFDSAGLREAEWTGTNTPGKSFGIYAHVGVDPSNGHVYVATQANSVVPGTESAVDEFEASASEEFVGRMTGTPKGTFAEGEPTTVAVDLGEPHAVFVGGESAVDEFYPDLRVPGVKTEAATDRTPLSATLNGTVEPVVGEEASAAECWFVYGTSEAELNKEARCHAPVTATEQVKVPIEKLLPGTEYFYRLEATNTGNRKTNTSEAPTAECDGQKTRDECFTTLGLKFEGSPSVLEISSTSATFEGSVDPNGGATSVLFQYGRCASVGTCASSGYEASSLPAPGEAIGAGTTPVEVPVQHVQGLDAGSTYHYRAVGVGEIELEDHERKTVELDGPEGTFTTQSPGEFKLIDGRAWEMVSAPEKEGALIERPDEETGRIIQAAAGGDAMTYLTNVPTEPGVVGYSNKAQVLSRRTRGGWVSEDLAQGHDGATGGSVEAGYEYRFFSEDLSKAIVQPSGAFLPCHSAGGALLPCLSEAASEQTAFLRTNFYDDNVDEPCTSSCLRPLVTGCPGEGKPCPRAVEEIADVPAGTHFGDEGGCPPLKYCGPRALPESPDLSHLVINIPEGLPGQYEWVNGKLTPGGKLPAPRVLESENGSWVYFASNSVLARGAVPGDCKINSGFVQPGGVVCDLYVTHEGMTQFIAVLSSEDYTHIDTDAVGLEHVTVRVSPNGRWLAFMSDRSPTGYDNRDAVTGEPDEEVYLYHAPEDLASESGSLTCASCDPTGSRPVGVQGGFGGGAVNTEETWSERWLAAIVPTWVRNANGIAPTYQPRYLSDSGRLFFDSHGALVPKDINGTWDVYEYEPEGVPANEHACSSSSRSGSIVYEPADEYAVEGRKGESGAGCVGLISSGESAQASAFMDASESGGDVFFMTISQLAPQDFDKAYDVYDAHECTSSSPCIPPPAGPAPECTTAEACRATPAPQPSIYGAPASATFNGVGNLVPAPASKPTTRTLTRTQKLAAALKVCRTKKNKQKRASCEKRARKNYEPVKKAKKSSKSHRGGK